MYLDFGDPVSVAGSGHFAGHGLLVDPYPIFCLLLEMVLHFSFDLARSLFHRYRVLLLHFQFHPNPFLLFD